MFILSASVPVIRYARKFRDRNKLLIKIMILKILLRLFRLYVMMSYDET